MNRNDYFRKIPKMDSILQDPSIRELCERLGKGLATEAIRYELESLRNLISVAREEEITCALQNFMEELPQKILEDTAFPLKKIYNATGIILHTNLGRAPLGKIQIDAAVQAMAGYSNLEYNLDTGKRGKRTAHYA